MSSELPSTSIFWIRKPVITIINMVADCPANCARWLLCLSNFIFIVVSAGVLVVGAWVSISKESFVEATLNITQHPNSPFSSLVDQDADKIIKEFVEPAVIDQAGYILIALGAFIFIISFLGYCGSIKESRVLLTAYGIFLIIIFCLQIALVVLCTAYKSHADTHTKGFLKHTLETYYTTGSNKDAVTHSWDLIMSHMQCCGVDNYHDFQTAKLFVNAASIEGFGRKIPEACCVLTGDKALITPQDASCTKNPTDTNSYWNTGCFDRTTQLIEDNLTLVIGAVVVVAAVELLAIIFSFCLCRAVGKERDYHHYKY